MEEKRRDRRTAGVDEHRGPLVLSSGFDLSRLKRHRCIEPEKCSRMRQWFYWRGEVPTTPLGDSL